MLQNIFVKFRFIALLEGCSFLAFALTMPLKYMFKMPTPNYYVGMIHGVLFILYCLLLAIVALKYKWSFIKTAMAFIASLIPFGTFIAAKKIYPNA
jgi:integral membrane protein